MERSQLQRIIPDEMVSALRDLVRNVYRDHPGYSWLCEDILEEVEELVSDELDMCRNVYPSPF